MIRPFKQLEKRKRDQALKDADRLNQQLTELRNESEGFERESAEALSVVPPPPPGSDALHHLENVLREREAELCDLERRAATWGSCASAARECAVECGMEIGERGLQKIMRMLLRHWTRATAPMRRSTRASGAVVIRDGVSLMRI